MCNDTKRVSECSVQFFFLSLSLSHSHSWQFCGRIHQLPHIIVMFILPFQIRIARRQTSASSRHLSNSNVYMRFNYNFWFVPFGKLLWQHGKYEFTLWSLAFEKIGSDWPTIKFIIFTNISQLQWIYRYPHWDSITDLHGPHFFIDKLFSILIYAMWKCIGIWGKLHNLQWNLHWYWSWVINGKPNESPIRNEPSMWHW